MTRAARRPSVDAFARVREIGLALPDMSSVVKYDGSPALQVHGCFVARLAMHPSAEPDTLIVRVPIDERAAMLEEAPDTYYVTAYYEPHPVVLVRLARVDRSVLAELLALSRQLALAKARPRRRAATPALTSRSARAGSARRL